MINKLTARLDGRLKRKDELANRVEKSDDINELRNINSEADILNDEILELRGLIQDAQDEKDKREQQEKAEAARLDEEKRVKENALEFNENLAPVESEKEARSRVIGTYGYNTGATTKANHDAEIAEQRGADLKAKKSITMEMHEMPEFRAVAVASLVVPTVESQEVNDIMFPEVSSVIDAVNSYNLPGGNSFQKAYVQGYGEGGVTDEQENYTESDPTVGYVDIGKSKITVYTEMTDEAANLPNINYQAIVRKNIAMALRKKIAKDIMTGSGAANNLKGIMVAQNTILPDDDDVDVAEIDEDTLDKIIFGYGGDEDISGNSYLILNKTDLAKFASIRTSDGRKLYSIKLQGNVGTISSDGAYEIPFIISSALSALTASGTGDDTLCMAFGKPAAYDLPIFSPVEIEESRDYKFKSGQIAFRGSVWVGGSVSAYKGFVRAKKVAGV